MVGVRCAGLLYFMLCRKIYFTTFFFVVPNHTWILGLDLNLLFD